MNKESFVALILFLLSSVIAFGQEEESVLSSPENWKSEIIPFPLGFAPAIDFVGFEDLRFAPGWSDSTNQQFWAYTFAWYIQKESAMTEAKLTEAFNLYYDGLMGVDLVNQVDSASSKQLDNTLCLFIKTSKGFSGKMRVYDRFFTKDYITLNIKVKETFCSKTNKQIVLCDISPKTFDHEVWQIFDDVSVKVECD